MDALSLPTTAGASHGICDSKAIVTTSAAANVTGASIFRLQRLRSGATKGPSFVRPSTGIRRRYRRYARRDADEFDQSPACRSSRRRGRGARCRQHARQVWGRRHNPGCRGRPQCRGSTAQSRLHDGGHRNHLDDYERGCDIARANIGSSRGGSTEGGGTIFNPEPWVDRGNCVKCVASLLDAIYNDDFVMTANEYPTTQLNGGWRGRAFQYLHDQVGVTIGPQVPHVPGGWIAPGDYVVLSDFTGTVPGHISFARSVGGELTFYDPQNGSTASSPGRLEVYPVQYPQPWP